MATAAECVLELPELLERILLSVPIRDVLLSQRVSRFWQALIANSLPLQQALFFKPVTKYEPFTALLLDEHHSNRFFNRPCLVDAVPVGDGGNHHEEIAPTLVADANPLLSWENSWFKKKCTNRTAAVRKAREAFGDGESTMDWDFPVSRKMTGIQPSWKKMFLSQPPSTRVFIRHDEGPGSEDWEISKVESDEGVKLGDISDAVRDITFGQETRPRRLVQYVSVVAVMLGYSEVIEEGTRKFKKLEDKIGREKAMRMGRMHPQNDLFKLLEGSNIDDLIEAGKMDAVVSGAIPLIQALVQHGKHKPRSSQTGAAGLPTDERSRTEAHDGCASQ